MASEAEVEAAVRKMFEHDYNIATPKGKAVMESMAEDALEAAERVRGERVVYRSSEQRSVFIMNGAVAVADDRIEPGEELVIRRSECLQ